MDLKAIFKKNDKPVLVVAFDQDGSVRRFCGKFQAWNSHDGELWLKDKSKVPSLFYAFEVASVKEITEESLIDNTNVLFEIIKRADQIKC